MQIWKCKCLTKDINSFSRMFGNSQQIMFWVCCCAVQAQATLGRSAKWVHPVNIDLLFQYFTIHLKQEQRALEKIAFTHTHKKRKFPSCTVYNSFNWPIFKNLFENNSWSKIYAQSFSRSSQSILAANRQKNKI